MHRRFGRDVMLEKSGQAVAMAAALCMFASAGGAPAQEAPHLIRGETLELLKTFYPQLAMRQYLPGDAWLTCSADASGIPTNCSVAHEWPRDFGFGGQALKMVPAFRASGPGVLVIHIHFGLKMGDLALCAPNSRYDCSITKPQRSVFNLTYPTTDSKVVSLLLRCTLKADGAVNVCGIPVNGDPSTFTAASQAVVNGYHFDPPLPRYVNGWVQLPVNLIPPDPDRPTARE